jgi:hypothetical protein
VLQTGWTDQHRRMLMAAVAPAVYYPCLDGGSQPHSNAHADAHAGAFVFLGARIQGERFARALYSQALDPAANPLTTQGRRPVRAESKPGN